MHRRRRMLDICRSGPDARWSNTPICHEPLTIQRAGRAYMLHPVYGRQRVHCVKDARQPETGGMRDACVSLFRVWSRSK